MDSPPIHRQFTDIFSICGIIILPTRIIHDESRHFTRLTFVYTKTKPKTRRNSTDSRQLFGTIPECAPDNERGMIILPTRNNHDKSQNFTYFTFVCTKTRPKSRKFHRHARFETFPNGVPNTERPLPGMRKFPQDGGDNINGQKQRCIFAV